ncbi:MAG: EF-P 5-aminopentanol modification-associated protein YfmF [Monoglobaceae bacterium]
MKTIKMCDGVDLHIVNEPKFKTNLMSVYFNIPLKRSTVTYAALLPAVLKRGCVKYPTLTDISRRLDDLYSTTVNAGVRTKGDGEVMYFTAEYVSDRFIGESISTEVADFLKEFIFSPLTVDGAFSETYVDSEKVNLKNAIAGLINDKREYAEFKCREAMFGQDGFGMFEAGYVEDLDEITPCSLYEFYKCVLETAKVDIFLSGAVDDRLVETAGDVLASAFKPREVEYAKTDIAENTNKPLKNVTEEADVVQSKLCMGLRCGVDPAGDEYPALVLGSCIFGGSPFSKLFMNVREKLSLAYYAGSKVAMFKSVMLISSGIQTENYQVAYDEIMAQFKKMQDGVIDEFEIESAKKYLSNTYNSLKDSLRGMEDYYLSQAILGSHGTIDKFLEKINAVTKEQICSVMNNIKFDTVYFLKGKLTGGEAE